MEEGEIFHCMTKVIPLVIVNLSHTCSAGEQPLDLMRRGVLCASTEHLAQQLVPHINHLEYPTK